MAKKEKHPLPKLVIIIGLVVAMLSPSVGWCRTISTSTSMACMKLSEWAKDAQDMRQLGWGSRRWKQQMRERLAADNWTPELISHNESMFSKAWYVASIYDVSESSDYIRGQVFSVCIETAPTQSTK